MQKAGFNCAIHCNTNGYVPPQGDGADSKGVGEKKVVGIEGPGTGGGKGSGGGIRRREGRKISRIEKAK